MNYFSQILVTLIFTIQVNYLFHFMLRDSFTITNITVAIHFFLKKNMTICNFAKKRVKKLYALFEF
jgi:hypothetical protein